MAAACPDPAPIPVVSGLKQELFHRHKEAQQCCRPHNLPLLRAAQQREMEVRGGPGWRGGCVPFPGGLAAPLLQDGSSIAASPEG